MARKIPDLNAAWEKAQAARSGDLTKEFNRAAEGPEPEADAVPDNNPEPNAPQSQSVKQPSRTFNEVSQEEGSRMVKETQPRHNMQPPPQIREPVVRASYNERLNQERQEALERARDKAREVQEMKERAPERVPELEP